MMGASLLGPRHSPCLWTERVSRRLRWQVIVADVHAGYLTMSIVFFLFIPFDILSCGDIDFLIG